ncbi:hypothetical protein CBL_01669 [Carabus blaptoides fortunei]
MVALEETVSTGESAIFAHFVIAQERHCILDLIILGNLVIRAPSYLFIDLHEYQLNLAKYGITLPNTSCTDTEERLMIRVLTRKKVGTPYARSLVWREDLTISRKWSTGHTYCEALLQLGSGSRGGQRETEHSHPPVYTASITRQLELSPLTL